MTRRHLEVLWISPEGRDLRLATDCLPELKVRSYAEVPSGEEARAAAAVLDLASGSSKAGIWAFGQRIRLDMPVLYLCRPEGVGPVLGQLLECDDVALGEDPPRLLHYRIATLWRRWSCDQESDVSPLRDLLTGLQNLKTFRRTLDRTIPAACPRRRLSLFWIDLDGFQQVNDRHDFETGNVVLRQVAVRLQALARVVGLAAAARVDADVFALLLQDGNAARVEAVAGQAQAVIGNLRFRPGPAEADIRLTASVGIATTDRPCPEPELVQRAREALLAAKARGRATVVHWSDLDRGGHRPRGEVARDVLDDIVQALGRQLQERLIAMGDDVIQDIGLRAEKDALTGIWNRGYLDRRLPHDFHAAGEHPPLTIALLDVDHFHDVNEKHGWPVGDAVLREVARRIVSSVREGDWVARYGGEEFLVVMPSTPPEAAYVVCERIRQAFADHPIRVSDELSVPVTVSLGETTKLPGDPAWDALLSRVASRLQKAKADGRNRVVDDAAYDEGAAGKGPVPRADR